MKHNGHTIFIAQLLICLAAAAAVTYNIVDRENELTALRRQLPQIERELRRLNEENRHLQYDVDRFATPLHLMELAEKPEFGHLHFPYSNDVVIIDERER